jgi:hypothetical protein
MASMNASGRPTALTKVPRPPRILSFATPDQVVGGEAGAVAAEDGDGVDGQAGGRHLRRYGGDRRALEVVGAVAGEVDDLSEAIDIASLDHAPPSQKGSPGGVAAFGAALGNHQGRGKARGAVRTVDDGPADDDLLRILRRPFDIGRDGAPDHWGGEGGQDAWGGNGLRVALPVEKRAASTMEQVGSARGIKSTSTSSVAARRARRKVRRSARMSARSRRDREG